MQNIPVSKSSLLNLLDKGEGAYALIDRNLEVVWCSAEFYRLFKSVTPGDRVTDIFPEFPDSFLADKNELVKFPYGNFIVQVTGFGGDAEDSGLILEVLRTAQEESNIVSGNMFQKEMQNILSLLIKENSLELLIEEILHRAVSITKSNIGAAVLFEEKSDPKTILFNNNKNINYDEIKNSVLSNLSYISKWLIRNKKPLKISTQQGTLGYALTESFNSSFVNIFPCFFDDRLVALIILGRDNFDYTITELNNIEQFAVLLSFAVISITTRELNAALESRLMQAQKLETIGKLASGMAHDFSNLLSSIFGSLNLLKKKVPPREDLFRLLDNIENCSVRAKDLTKGLLSYGKPTPKRKELVKPNMLLGEISKVINQTFPKNIEFIQRIDENIYDILGNSTEIYQVLLNLCVNAKEAIEEKGKIILSGKNFTLSDNNQMDHPLLEKGNYVQFSVQDTGSGIKEENIQKIFDPYFSTKVKETGSGLGLYVTYGIIKAHKGQIEVSSSDNGGTRFDVFIPSFEPNVKKETEAAPDKIILLADDEVMLRDLLAELLESNGYNVVKVFSGKEALRVLTEEIKVDLAIIDYNMPEMNGLDCISTLRQLGFTMPVILSSGSLSIETIIDPKKMGINSILSKPYEFESMLATIKNLI